MVAVSSWGRLNRLEHDVIAIADRRLASQQICQSHPGIAHGMGRSYGDVCLNPGGILWKSTGLDRLIQFDEQTGRLVCEAGVLLRDIQRLMVPRGWMLAVTPGTQLVTVGGAIANDVHGKNHHVHGSFGNHLLQLTLLRTDGEIIECGPLHHANWFAATVGGLGLTGFILTAEIQLRRVAGPWLESETIPYANLEEFFTLADDSETGFEHTVSWIDCLSGGRGLFMRANHSSHQQLFTNKPSKWRIPLVPPVSLINKYNLAPFNSTYYHLKKSQTGRNIVHYEPFMYPLDNVQDWNRLYGPGGFYQYQSVVPREAGMDATRAMLQEISRSGEGSFLAVLKTFGEIVSAGMLSFPRPGVTLALDFPNNGENTLRLFERLDKIVGEAGGRIYAAKDARMPQSLFVAGYPRLAEFLQFRDPGISSAMSRRLIGS